jgi:hypothetical protein
LEAFEIAGRIAKREVYFQFLKGSRYELTIVDSFTSKPESFLFLSPCRNREVLPHLLKKARYAFLKVSSR